MFETSSSAAARLFAFVFLVCLSVSRAGAAPATSAVEPRLHYLEETAAGLAASLDVHDHVQIMIVPENRLVVSVEALHFPNDGYRLMIDSRFLDKLDDEEISAAIAHELGHIWIYSHHPFLQTEALANEIAMRAVPRKLMESLYSKLWAYTGTPGRLEELLGVPAVAHAAND